MNIILGEKKKTLHIFGKEGFCVQSKEGSRICYKRINVRYIQAFIWVGGDGLFGFSTIILYKKNCNTKDAFVQLAQIFFFYFADLICKTRK